MVRGRAVVLLARGPQMRHRDDDQDPDRQQHGDGQEEDGGEGQHVLIVHARRGDPRERPA